MDYSKIAVISTVVNFDLYQKSAVYFAEGIQKYIIDGRTGMYGIHSICYMMKKLKNKDIDWLIMADEDVYFSDSESVFSIIKKLEEEQLLFAGVRDGGVIRHRNYNPSAGNTFFSILNFKEIEKIWNKKEMLSHQYIHSNEFNDTIDFAYDFDLKSLYEPYYCFYFWLRRKKNAALFLESKHLINQDAITNSVLNLNGAVFLYHTWYARAYGKNKAQTERINSVFPPETAVKLQLDDVIIFKDVTFAFRLKLNKIAQKIRMKFKNLK